jgi:steroid delta-isomerase-like uncharacterized protein
VFVDREDGRVVAMTGWATQEARASSNTGLAPLRAEAARLMGGTAGTAQYEVVVDERVVPPTPGCWMRSTAISGEPARIREGITEYQSSVIPALRAIPGFCGAMLIVDPSSGQAIGWTLWDSRESLTASRTAASGLRANVAQGTGVQVTGVSEYEVVLAETEAPRYETLFRRAYEIMSAGDLNDLDDLIAEDYVEHAAVPPDTPAGRAGVKAVVAQYRQAFPDLRITIEKYLEQGDTGCAVLRVTGTQTGSLLGLPATGRTIDICMVDLARVADGRAVEHWGASDDLGMLTQLGLAPVPAEVAVPAQQSGAGDQAPKVQA